MKLILGALLLFSLGFGHAQNQTIQGSDSIEFTALIESFEASSDFQFYYKPEWVNNIKVVIPDSITAFDNPESLQGILSGTSLTYYINNKDIILVKDTRIIEQPAISSFYKKPVDVPIEKGFIFSREYLATEGTKVEDQIFEVGQRSKFQKNKKSTIAGYVTEKSSGIPVEGAFVYVQTPFVGATTNAEGFYSITIPSGEQTLLIQSVNMKNTNRNLVVLSDGKLDVAMDVDVIALNAVTVSSEREFNVKSPQMGLTRITKENIKIVPALLGERDIIKVATTSAGIQFLGEGAAGINIRGGKADQNLFLLDGLPVYNTNHFFGFFSVFNPETIEGLEVYKSGIPAKFGGRLSSVFDISSKKLGKDKLSGSGGIGPVTSNIAIEGGLGENGPSILLGGRANYSSFVLNRVSNSPLGNNSASFYDLMGKIEQKIDERNEIAITGYFSFDGFQLTSDTLLSYSEFTYRNELFAVNWKHIVNDRLFINTKVGRSRYQYDVDYDELASQAFQVGFDLQEDNASINFDFLKNDRWSYQFGLETKKFSINPGNKTAVGSESLINPDQILEEQGLETSGYFSAQYSPKENLTIDGGIRYSMFNALGPGLEYTYGSGSTRDVNNRIDSLSFDKGEIIETYHGPEIRLSGRYSLNNSSSLKASYNRTRQYIHLLQNAASIAPTDNWRLSNGYIKPQIADQYSVGFYKNFYGKNLVEASAEVYYKDIQNLVDFKVGTDLQFNKALETDILQGDGRSYGIELSVKKSAGWWTGWLNYTFSRSLIRLDGAFPEETINDGSFFATGYDKPHYINSITNYKFTRRLTFTVNVIYATGVPVTYPVGKWTFKGVENLFYSDRNAFRIPDYFRTDFGINLEGSHKVKKLAHSSWTFSIYNVLGRDNVYSVFFKVDEGVVQGYKLTVFKNPIPTVTYNFSF